MGEHLVLDDEEIEDLACSMFECFEKGDPTPHPDPYWDELSDARKEQWRHAADCALTFFNDITNGRS